MCKGFLERNRGSAAAAPIDQQKPASEKPLPSNLSSGPESAVGAIQPEKSEPDISQPEPIQVDTVSSIDPSGASSKGANKKKAPLISSRDCKRYRSFDAASETYRDNAGHRRPCHSWVWQLFSRTKVGLVLLRASPRPFTCLEIGRALVEEGVHALAEILAHIGFQDQSSPSIRAATS
jgi:hypothetical protein